MSKALLFTPITDPVVETLFLRICGSRYRIPAEILVAMRDYYRNPVLRPETKYDLYYILNMFAGQRIAFPTVEQLCETQNDVMIYLETAGGLEALGDTGSTTDLWISVAERHQVVPTRVKTIYDDFTEILNN